MEKERHGPCTLKERKFSSLLVSSSEEGRCALFCLAFCGVVFGVGWGQDRVDNKHAGRESSACELKAGYNVELGAGMFLELRQSQCGYSPVKERTGPDCGLCRHVKDTHLSPKSKGKPF